MSKEHVLENIFRRLKSLLKQHTSLLQAGPEDKNSFCLLWPDRQLFVAVELRHLSVALFLDSTKISDSITLPRAVAGTLDKNGWFHLTTNKEIYGKEIKELLQLASYVLAQSDDNGATQAIATVLHHVN